jgi:hypothetical protein
MGSEQSDQPDVDVEFRFPATSEATTVAVAGAFNGWSAEADPLERGSDGAWSTTLRLPPGRHAYRFVVDGERWENDAEADAYESNELGDENSVRIVRPDKLQDAAGAEAQAIAENTSAEEIKPDTELVAPSTSTSATPQEARGHDRTGSDAGGAPAGSPETEAGEERTFQQGSGQPSPSIGEQQQSVRPTP